MAARPDRTGPRWADARARASELAPKMVAYLQRIGPALAALARSVRAVGVVGLVAATLLWVAVLSVVRPSGLPGILVVVIALVALGAPGALLLWTAWAIGQLAQLPDVLRRSPDLVRDNGDALAKLYLDTAAEWGEASRFRLLGGGLVRATKLAWAVVSDLPDVRGALVLASPWYLAASGVALALVVGEVVAVPIGVAVAVVLRLG